MKKSKAHYQNVINTIDFIEARTGYRPQMLYVNETEYEAVKEELFKRHKHLPVWGVSLRGVDIVLKKEWKK